MGIEGSVVEVKLAEQGRAALGRVGEAVGLDGEQDGGVALGAANGLRPTDQASMRASRSAPCAAAADRSASWPCRKAIPPAAPARRRAAPAPTSRRRSRWAVRWAARLSASRAPAARQQEGAFERERRPVQPPGPRAPTRGASPGTARCRPAHRRPNLGSPSPGAGAGQPSRSSSIHPCKRSQRVSSASWATSRVGSAAGVVTVGDEQPGGDERFGDHACARGQLAEPCPPSGVGPRPPGTTIRRPNNSRAIGLGVGVQGREHLVGPAADGAGQAPDRGEGRGADPSRRPGGRTARSARTAAAGGRRAGRRHR